MPPRKRTADKPVEPETTQIDTSKHVDPNEDVSEETTPIHDQLLEDIKNAPEEEVTHLDEDDDPLTHIGEATGEPAPTEPEETA